MASVYIQQLHWAVTLSVYSYTTEYKPGQYNSNADALSRLPLPDEPTEIPTPADTIFLMDQINSTTVTAALMRWWTLLISIIKSKSSCDERLKIFISSSMMPYFKKHCVKSGCILRGYRVIVSERGQANILELLHDAH